MKQKKKKSVSIKRRFPAQRTHEEHLRILCLSAIAEYYLLVLALQYGKISHAITGKYRRQQDFISGCSDYEFPLTLIKTKYLLP